MKCPFCENDTEVEIIELEYGLVEPQLYDVNCLICGMNICITEKEFKKLLNIHNKNK